MRVQLHAHEVMRGGEPRIDQEGEHGRTGDSVWPVKGSEEWLVSVSLYLPGHSKVPCGAEIDGWRCSLMSGVPRSMTKFHDERHAGLLQV
jgi:hypothetical protein